MMTKSGRLFWLQAAILTGAVGTMLLSQTAPSQAQGYNAGSNNVIVNYDVLDSLASVSGNGASVVSGNAMEAGQTGFAGTYPTANPRPTFMPNNIGAATGTAPTIAPGFTPYAAIAGSTANPDQRIHLKAPIGQKQKTAAAKKKKAAAKPQSETKQISDKAGKAAATGSSDASLSKDAEATSGSAASVASTTADNEIRLASAENDVKSMPAKAGDAQSEIPAGTSASVADKSAATSNAAMPSEKATSDRMDGEKMGGGTADTDTADTSASSTAAKPDEKKIVSSAPAPAEPVDNQHKATESSTASSNEPAASTGETSAAAKPANGSASGNSSAMVSSASAAPLPTAAVADGAATPVAMTADTPVKLIGAGTQIASVTTAAVAPTNTQTAATEAAASQQTDSQANSAPATEGSAGPDTVAQSTVGQPPAEPTTIPSSVPSPTEMLKGTGIPIPTADGSPAVAVPASPAEGKKAETAGQQPAKASNEAASGAAAPAATVLESAPRPVPAPAAATAATEPAPTESSSPTPPPAPDASVPAASTTPAPSEPAAAPTPATTPQAEVSIAFTDSNTDLPASSTAALDQLASKMMADENLRVQIMAYASGTPETESNARRTSLARGLAVRQYLYSKGIRSTRMDVRALGLKGNGADRVDVVPADVVQ